MGAQTIYNFRSVAVDFVPTLDTNAYAQNDILFDLQEAALGQGDRVKGTINGFTLVDKDDQGSQLTLVFSDSSTASLGTVNTAPSPTDADAATILGYVDTGETYEDLVNSQIVKPAAFTPIPFRTENGSIYIGAILRGAVTPTHTASGFTIRLHLTIE